MCNICKQRLRQALPGIRWDVTCVILCRLGLISARMIEDAEGEQQQQQQDSGRQRQSGLEEDDGLERDVQSWEETEQGDMLEEEEEQEAVGSEARHHERFEQQQQQQQPRNESVRPRESFEELFDRHGVAFHLDF